MPQRMENLALKRCVGPAYHHKLSCGNNQLCIDTDMEKRTRCVLAMEHSVQFSSVAQSCLTLCDPMNCSQVSLSIANSQSPLKLTSIESVMPSSHLILCRPLLLLPPIPLMPPASESFLMSQLFAWGGQGTGVSALASVLPKKFQGWSPSEWTGWIS